MRGGPQAVLKRRLRRRFRWVLFEMNSMCRMWSQCWTCRENFCPYIRCHVYHRHRRHRRRRHPRMAAAEDTQVTAAEELGPWDPEHIYSKYIYMVPPRIR